MCQPVHNGTQYSELSLCSFISAATIEIVVDGVVREGEDANVCLKVLDFPVDLQCPIAFSFDVFIHYQYSNGEDPYNGWETPAIMNTSTDCVFLQGNL